MGKLKLFRPSKTTSMTAQQRIGYLDAVRVFACLFIIIIHSPMPNIGTNALVLDAISLYMAPGLGLFFMVSGALLLPVKGSGEAFLRHRLGKVVCPTLFWTCFYLLANALYYGTSGEETLRSVLSIPFSPQGQGVMWFMYTLVGLYFLAPILSPWLRQATRRELEIVLLLWAITLCFPLLERCVNIDTSASGALFYFSGYAGYFLLGYYLHTYRPHFSLWFLLALFIVPSAVAVVFKLCNISVDFYKVFWYLSIFCVQMSFAWFLLAQRQAHWFAPRPWLTRLSNSCFGIYLIHIFVMRYVLWRCPFMASLGGVGQIVFTTVLTFLLSYGITLCIARLPWATYIIGTGGGRKHP